MKRIALPMAAMLLISVVHACNIPVFRYALERWQPDHCKVTITYREALTARQQESVGALKKAANIDVVLKQSDKATDSANTVVSCQVTNGYKVNVWQGDLADLPKLHLNKSPARSELSRRLLKGDAVVWLMIQSKDDAKNKAARKRMKKEFVALEKKVPMPEGIGLPGSELFSDVPLLLKFSLLEIDATDPKEAFLVKFLTGIQSDAFADGEPLLVPVFGRGRALEVIPASDLTSSLIEDLTMFLSGACSCQVKERNPGFDLLIAADWDKELFGEDGEVPPDAPERQQTGGKPVLVPIP